MTAEHATAGAGPAPASPCIGICLMDPRTRLCRGCWRNIDEIAAWHGADRAERHAILARIAARRPPETR